METQRLTEDAVLNFHNIFSPPEHLMPKGTSVQKHQPGILPTVCAGRMPPGPSPAPAALDADWQPFWFAYTAHNTFLLPQQQLRGP